MLCLGIDIGGTKINVGIISVDGEKATVKGIRRISSTTISDPASEIASAVRALARDVGVSLESLCGCGVGVPGTVSRDGRRVLKAPNLPWMTEDFCERFEVLLGLPVRLVQDSRAAALGEARCGGGRGLSVVVVLTLGTGLGTGITVEGQIFDGGLGSAGELGHVPVVRNGRPCGCGKRGCLEKYAAGGGLDLTACEILGGDSTARELFLAEQMGNEEAARAISFAVEALGQAVTTTVNLLSPNAVLFSGGLGNHVGYVSRVTEYVKKHCYSSGALPMLGAAELGDLAPLVGAALYGAGDEIE